MLGPQVPLEPLHHQQQRGLRALRLPLLDPHLSQSAFVLECFEERDPYYSPPGPLVVETVKLNAETGESDPNLDYD